jgi:hypothetical protein
VNVSAHRRNGSAVTASIWCRRGRSCGFGHPPLWPERVVLLSEESADLVAQGRELWMPGGGARPRHEDCSARSTARSLALRFRHLGDLRVRALAFSL